jgi:hypothetical protein
MRIGDRAKNLRKQTGARKRISSLGIGVYPATMSVGKINFTSIAGPYPDWLGGLSQFLGGSRVFRTYNDSIF